MKEKMMIPKFKKFKNKKEKKIEEDIPSSSDDNIEILKKKTKREKKNIMKE